MEFYTKSARLTFAKDFKPKSLAKFIKDFRGGGTDEELKVIFDKLNGNNIKSNKKGRKVKPTGNNK